MTSGQRIVLVVTALVALPLVIAIIRREGRRSAGSTAGPRARRLKTVLDAPTKNTFVDAVNDFIVANNDMHVMVNASSEADAQAAAVDAHLPRMMAAIARMRTVAAELGDALRVVADAMTGAAERAVGSANAFRDAAKRFDPEAAARSAAANDQAIRDLNAATEEWKQL